MNSIDNEIIPDEGTSDATEQSSSNLVEVNGKQLTIEELKAGYMMQSDYTRKMQELKKPTQDSTQQAPDEAALNAWLKDQGYVKADEMEARTLQTERELWFKDFFRDNPELRNKEQMIRDLAINGNMAVEDVIVKYNLADMDKLQKAKSNRTMVGSTDRNEPIEKTIADMSPTEYEAFKAKNSSKFSSSKFSKVKTI